MGEKPRKRLKDYLLEGGAKGRTFAPSRSPNSLYTVENIEQEYDDGYVGFLVVRNLQSNKSHRQHLGASLEHLEATEEQLTQSKKVKNEDPNAPLYLKSGEPVFPEEF